MRVTVLLRLHIPTQRNHLEKHVQWGQPHLGKLNTIDVITTSVKVSLLSSMHICPTNQTSCNLFIETFDPNARAIVFNHLYVLWIFMGDCFQNNHRPWMFICFMMMRKSAGESSSVCQLVSLHGSVTGLTYTKKNICCFLSVIYL